MKLNRDNIFKKYNWLREKKRPFIISCDYDGIICASFLNHYLNWDLVGYYDYTSIWLSNKAIEHKKQIIWVDLNILPNTGKSIGVHIVSRNNKYPTGSTTSCNPNILMNITSNDFKNKFPFSTLIFLLWLHNIKYYNNIFAKLLILHSDNTWMKMQKYPRNINFWTNCLSDFKWELFFDQANSLEFEEKVDQILYPKLIKLGAGNKFSKLTSKYLNIKSRESIINPDWDTDIILKLFNLFAEILDWTPPKLPIINKKINGSQYKIPINRIKKNGLINYIKKNNIFSYAFISPKEFSYTIFNTYKEK